MGNGSISGCCDSKPVPVNIAAATLQNIEVKKKDTPHGYAKLFAGVRIPDNKYTSPILSVHTWNEGKQSIAVQHGHLKGIGGPGGMSSDRSRSTLLTEAGQKNEYKQDLDEDIHMIPVEDILSVNISTEIKRTVEQNKMVRVKTPPPEDLSCTAEMDRCCIRNVCCWCRKEKRIAPEHIVTSTEKQGAVRAIVLTLEYVRYTLLHTPSNVQIVDKDTRNEFFKKHLKTEELKFFYLHNEEYSGEGYKKNFEESEALSRIILQLKAMKDYYPDSKELQQIISQDFIHLFGFEPKETNPILLGSTTAHIATAVAIKHGNKDDDD